MRHLHLAIPGDCYSPAAIHSILERGGASDIKALLLALHDDPFSETAMAAERVARESEVYGYPALILKCLGEWRQHHERSGGQADDSDIGKA
ncbi:hypothetical protein ACHMW5_11595 [Azospirillum melinis]|uniref:hypothetical protein n=1 Tax=Azospirillum melinis TaxID=328839 RepID=UPI0037569E88